MTPNAEKKLWGAKTGMGLFHYLLACIAATALHEMAHILAALASGIRVKRLGVDWKGPYIVREQGPPLANLCIALAGPVLNLALAVLCWTCARQFALVNVALGGYNLLPFVRGLDGYHALAAYRNLRCTRDWQGLPSGGRQGVDTLPS